MTAAAAGTKIEATAKLLFALRITHFDAPPPPSQPDVEALLAADAIRFANQLRAWIYVKDGQITNFGTAGGGPTGLHNRPARVPILDVRGCCHVGDQRTA